MKLLRILFLFFVLAEVMTACQKEHSIENGNKLQYIGDWEFSNGSLEYSGVMDTVFRVKAGSTNELFIVGETKDGSQSFELHLFADTFKVGSYKASAFQSSLLYTSASGKSIYQASQLVGEFTVNVTTLDDENIEGDFSGTAKDSTGNILQLINGKFNATYAAGSVNPASVGTLGDSSGNCTPFLIFGNYSKGIPVNSSNQIQVHVTVTNTGPFAIQTNVVNGISFSKSGNFQFTGQQNVLLDANGTPTSAGNGNFTLHYGNSQCTFTLPILGDAEGILGSGGGDCTPFTLSGTYQQGTEFNTGNTVKIEVNVTTPGAYHITTNTINGVSFAGAGTLSTTGVHEIILTGSGTPLNSGLQNFFVMFESSTCSFPITFLPAAGPSGDYFPTTINSNWKYHVVSGSPSGDMMRTIINYTPTLGGQAYTTLQQTLPDNTITDSFYYRKPGGDYYQYVNFSAYFGFDQYTGSEFIFLKDDVPDSTTWNSPQINGTIGGVSVSGYAKMTILDKGVSVTSIPGFNFPDVIKVKYEYFLVGNPTPVLIQERWFAKNAGEIYFSIDDGNTKTVYEAYNYQVF